MPLSFSLSSSLPFTFPFFLLRSTKKPKGRIFSASFLPLRLMRFALAGPASRLRPPFTPLRPVFKARPSYLLVSYGGGSRERRETREKESFLFHRMKGLRCEMRPSPLEKDKEDVSIFRSQRRLRSREPHHRGLLDVPRPLIHSKRRDSTWNVVASFLALSLFHSLTIERKKTNPNRPWPRPRATTAPRPWPCSASARSPRAPTVS